MFRVSNSSYFRDGTNVVQVQPITAHRTGQRGRPLKVIDEAYLRAALGPDMNLTISGIARALGCTRKTVKKNMELYGITQEFSTITEDQLDAAVHEYKGRKPASGYRYVHGFLRSQGLRVQRRRVMRALNRVDRLGRILRQRKTIQRRKYHSSRPNALWHCDGHHKLILWGIVIHGFVDGHCRTVCNKVRMCDM